MLTAGWVNPERFAKAVAVTPNCLAAVDLDGCTGSIPADTDPPGTKWICTGFEKAARVFDVTG